MGSISELGTMFETKLCKYDGDQRRMADWSRLMPWRGIRLVNSMGISAFSLQKKYCIIYFQL